MTTTSVDSPHASSAPTKRWHYTLRDRSATLIGLAFLTLFAYVVVMGIADAVHHSSQEKALDDITDRAVSIIGARSEINEAGDLTVPKRGVTLIDELEKEFESDDVRITATSLTTKWITIIHKGETKSIKLAGFDGTGPKAQKDLKWSMGVLGAPFNDGMKRTSGTPSATTNRVAATISQYSKQNGMRGGITEQDLIDTRTKGDELPDLLKERFTEQVPDIEMCESWGCGSDRSATLTVDPDDDAEYVHMSSSPHGSNIASTRIDHIELMHTD